MGEGITKFLRAKPIEIEVERIDGTSITLKCETMNRDLAVKIVQIGIDDKNSARALYEQMAAYFGGNAKDYFNIDVRVVTKVIAWMGEQLKDPT